MAMLRAILCSLTALCAVAACGPASSPPESGWARTYGGGSSYRASTVRVTADGEYVVAGTVAPPIFADADIWLLRIKRDGAIVWQRTYGGPSWDTFNSMEPTADGGLVVAGSTESFGAGATDAWVLRLDGGGNVIWQRTFGGTGRDSANAVQPTMDGGYIVAGFLSEPGSYDQRTWVLKLDASGGVVWQREYGGGGAASVKQTADGGYVIAASNVLDVMKTATDFQILKLDASGNVASERTYATKLGDSLTFLNDHVTQLHVMSDGGFLISGVSSPPGAPVGWSGWMLRIDASGNVVWTKGYPGWIASIQATGDGFVVAGRVHAPSNVYETNPWLTKMDSGGNVIWQRYVADGGGRGTFSAAQLTADGGYVVAGTTSPDENGLTAVRVLRVASDGSSADCASLASYDRAPGERGVIAGNIPANAIATQVVPAISQAIPGTSNASVGQACGSAPD